MSELDTSAYKSVENTGNSGNTTAQSRVETGEDEPLDSKQVTEHLNHLKKIVENSKNTELVNQAKKSIQKIQDNQPKKEIRIKKFQCLKCKKVFPSKNSYTGHYYGNPHCGDTPRWTSEYDNAEQQLNTIRK